MTWWTDLSQKGRGIVALISLVIGALGGAFALGAATRDTVTGHRDLPARVTAVEKQVDRMAPMVDALRVAHDRTDTKLAALDSLRLDVGDIKCILRAEIHGTPPAACLMRNQ